jgi:hypothetical protein
MAYSASSSISKSISFLEKENSCQVSLFQSKTHNEIISSHAKSKCSFCNEIAPFVILIEKVYYEQQKSTKVCQNCIEDVFSLFPIKFSFYDTELDSKISHAEMIGNFELKEILLQRKEKLRFYAPKITEMENHSFKRKRNPQRIIMHGIQGLYLSGLHYATLKTFEICNFCNLICDIVLFFMHGINRRFCLPCVQRIFQEEFPIQKEEIERMHTTQNALYCLEKSRLEIRHTKQMESIQKLYSFVDFAA